MPSSSKTCPEGPETTLDIRAISYFFFCKSSEGGAFPKRDRTKATILLQNTPIPRMEAVAT
jgi:hypothetical protein